MSIIKAKTAKPAQIRYHDHFLIKVISAMGNKLPGECRKPFVQRAVIGRLWSAAVFACRCLMLGMLLNWAVVAEAQSLHRELPPPSSFEVIVAGPQQIALLRRGGLVLYMRHGATDARYPDQIPVNLEDCGSQRPLSATGRQQLDQIGAYFARLGIPYQTVISSPFCRAQESARRVFGNAIKVDPQLRYTAVMNEVEKRPAVLRTRELISMPVEAPGQNRIVVAHGPNIAEIMDYLPAEGTMLIFRPLGLEAEGGFEYLASIGHGDWPELLRQLAGKAEQ